MGKGKTSNGQIAKYRKLAAQYREMANEAMGSIASYKGALDKLNKELATFIGKDMSVDAEREKRDAVKSQIAANNDVLKGLSSKYKNADAIARRYEAMCGIDSPEAVEVEDIAAVEEGASSESTSAQAPIQETEVEEAAPVCAATEAPVTEESVAEKPVEVKESPAAAGVSSKKLNPLWAIIPLMLLSMLVGGALLRADKPRYYTSDIAVSPAVTATAPAATAAPKAETATVKVEAEKPQTSETPVIEVEKKAEKVEEVASQGVSVEGNATAIEKTPVEPETVAAVPAKAEEKPIAMFFGVSDAEVEQKYKAEGYDVVVLPPVVEEVVAAPEPVVETVEVTVEAEPVVEVIAEPEVVEVVIETVEEPAAPVYEHHVECYGYSADIVASEGVACVTYPEFVTTQEIYDMAAAAAYAYGDAVRDVYVEVKEPGLFEMTYPTSYTEADIEYAFATIDRDLPYYIASLFPTQAEEPVVEETVEVSVEAEPVVEVVEAVVVEEPAAPVYEHHVECYGYSADIVASEGVACVTYPEFVTTQEIYDMAAAAAYAYGDAVKDVYVEVKEPGLFEMTYPTSYTEADIEYAFATIDRDLPIYIASLFAAQAEEPVVEETVEVVEVVDEPEVVEVTVEVEAVAETAPVEIEVVIAPAPEPVEIVVETVKAEEPAVVEVEVAAVAQEPAERPIAMLLGYSDVEAEKAFRDADYEVIVLDYVPAAPVFFAPVEQAVEVEPVVETVEVAVEATVESVEVSVEAVAEPEVVEAIAEPAAPVYEHHVECYGYSADIVASEGVACVTYPEFVTTQEIYDMAAAAAYAYGDAVKDVYVEVKQPGLFEMTYPVSYTEADIEYAFATIDRDLPIYIASLFAVQAEEPIEVEEVVETAPVEIEVEVAPAPEPVEVVVEIVKAEEPAVVEIEVAAVAQEPAERPIAMLLGYSDAEAEKAYRDADYEVIVLNYVPAAPVFFAPAEKAVEAEPAVEVVTEPEVVVEAIEEPAAEEVVEVAVEVEEAAETTPVEIEVEVAPAPEPVEIEIEFTTTPEPVEVNVEIVKAEEPAVVEIEVVAVAQEPAEKPIAMLLGYSDAEAEKAYRDADYEVIVLNYVPAAPVFFAPAEKAVEAEPVVETVEVAVESEPVVEAVVEPEIVVEAIEEPAAEEVVEIAVDVEEAAETTPVEIEVEVAPAPEPVEIEIEFTTTPEPVEVSVEIVKAEEPAVVEIEVSAVAQEPAEKPIAMLLGYSDAEAEKAYRDANYEVIVLNYVPAAPVFFAPAEKAVEAEPVVETVEVSVESEPVVEAVAEPEVVVEAIEEPAAEEVVEVAVEVEEAAETTPVEIEVEVAPAPEPVEIEIEFTTTPEPVEVSVEIVKAEEPAVVEIEVVEVAAVAQEAAEKPIAMLLGYSDAEAEKAYRDADYEVIVLNYVPAAPVFFAPAEKTVEAEPVVETLEVAVESEPVVEAVVEPEVAVEAIEEPAAEEVVEVAIEVEVSPAPEPVEIEIEISAAPEPVEVVVETAKAEEPVVVEAEVVEIVAAVAQEPVEKPIAMLLGYSDAKEEKSYRDAGYEVIVLNYVPAAPVFFAPAEKPVEAEPVSEVVAEPEVVEVAVEAEPVVEAVEAVVVEEPAAPVYEHHVECYGYSADIVASEGVACVTYPEFVTTQEIYDMAAAAAYAYGDAVKDVYVEVKEPGLFEMTYPTSYTEADIEYAFATIDRDLPIYIASLFAVQAEEPVVEEVVEVVAEPVAPVYEHHVECYGYSADIVASEGVACVTYPAFVTTQEIYDMAAAAANAYGDAVKDVYVEVKQAGMFEMTYPVSYTEADIEYAFATIDRDLPIYIASLFAAQAEEPVVEETVEVSVEAVEEPATEEVVEVTVEVEAVAETAPVEVEISVEPAPEPVEIEIETIPASKAVEVEVEKAETSEPVAIAVETKAPKTEAKDLFKSCSFSSGIVPYSYQKLYTEDTSLITGVGFKASAFKYFKSHYVALGLEYTGITHQYETKSFSDQKGLLKFRTYIPFNKSGESMMFVSSGIGGALITENNGQTKLFGLVAADLGVSFRLADDLALEISTNAVAAFRRYLRSIEVDASVAMTYHF